MTTTPQSAPRPDALDRRRRVLELSGWGQEFRLWQPHNLCFWVYAAVMAIGIVNLINYVNDRATVVGGAFAAGLAATIVYGLLFVAFLRFSEHYERQPRKLVLTAFLWGGVAATFGMAIVANSAMLEIYPKLFGQAFGTDWGAALTAPFTEETTKAAGFILLLGLAPRVVRTPYDGIFLGAFIGLGFQLFEDVTYSVATATAAFGVDESHIALQTFALRAVTGVFSHTLFTALFCCGLIFVIGTPAQPRRLGVGIGLIALSMLTHGVWDGSAAIGDGGATALLAGLVLGLIALAALFVALRRTAPKEREFLRGVMQPEVENGTITAAELDALCSPGRRRRKFARHSGTGHRAHCAEKHVLRASLDLAHELAESGGRDTAGVEHERAEIARLRGGIAAA
jgi:protease PrsW